jgi:hypothetical protein
MYTLDSPRYEWYENSDYVVIQENVLGQVNEAVGALGFYPVHTDEPLLSSMQIYQYAVLFIGLIFGLLNVLFISISTLLIYSLLQISVEKKTF